MKDPKPGERWLATVELEDGIERPRVLEIMFVDSGWIHSAHDVVTGKELTGSTSDLLYKLPHPADDSEP